MSILVDRTKRVLIQGITGREGMARTQLMTEYGTQVVAGVTPGRGGQTVSGVRVFDSVNQAIEQSGPIDISVIFVPAPLVKSAAIESLHAGIKLLVIIPDRVPLYDVLEVAAVAEAQGADFLGPNTLGVLSPGEAVLGMMGGRADSIRKWAIPGNVGISSRSGGVTTSMAYYITKVGLGLSTMVHVGGDSVVGMGHPDVLRRFQDDPQTEAVVMFGEIGTSQEEDAAALIESGLFTKPLIAYIGGKAAKEGMRFSHAGAIIEGETGTYAGKVKRLREVGATIVESFGDIPRFTAEVLEKHRQKPKSPHRTANTPPISKSPDDLHWTTAITAIAPDNIRVRGHNIEEMMANLTFSQAIYLLLTGHVPSASVGRVLDAILVSSIDHGATPPSTLAARTAASTGAPINGALAAGLLSINQYHGGAIENCMHMILKAIRLSEETAITHAEAATRLVATYQSEQKRLPGFGHRIHKNDPRTAALFALAEEGDVAANAVAMVRQIESVLEASGKKLPVNVDGAIAALLLDLEIPPALGNTFFMMARVPGLIAHIYEEQTQERPMRQIHPSDHSYMESV